MKSYYKYTNGDAFTLNGEKYTGFFHFKDNAAYTGVDDYKKMQKLTPQHTFMYDFFSHKKNFNNIYNNIDTITKYLANTFDLLNKEGLDSAFGQLDSNNLTCFKNLITYNPNIYETKAGDIFCYGIYSPHTGMNIYDFALPLDEFKFYDDWKFLDDVVSGTFVVSVEEDFKYFCATPTTLYVLKGSFIKGTPLSILTSQTTEDAYLALYQDTSNEELLVLTKNSIKIYDLSNFYICDTLILKDSISLSNPIDETTKKWVKIGKNIRVELNTSKNKMYVFNKNTTELFDTVELDSYDVKTPMAMDVRFTDDLLLLLFISNDNETSLLELDISNDIHKTTPVHDISTRKNYDLKFSMSDSDIFYLFNMNKTEMRFISRPERMAGRMENGELLYPRNFKWKEPDITYDTFLGKWNYANQPSNIFNNLVFSEHYSNGNVYTLIHNISRLYPMKNAAASSLFSMIPTTISKNFNGISCSESSMGLYFNSAISNIVKDVLSLYVNAYGTLKFKKDEILVETLNEIEETTNDLYINGNETFNVVSMQRIFSLIDKLQTNLLATSE